MISGGMLTEIVILDNGAGSVHLHNIIRKQHTLMKGFSTNVQWQYSAPGVQMNPQPATGPRPTPRRRNHWSRRKKVAVCLVVLMVLTPFLTAGVYMWNISRAIEGVQDRAVVNLPTSQMELGGVSHNDDDAITGTPVPIDDESGNHITEDIEPTATVGPDQPASDRSNPSAMGIARDIIGTGTRADVVKPSEVWPGKRRN